MRTLLVDNYDSFTYNLFHYLAQVTGREPEVVVNDDPSWRLGHLDSFDNVVLSPGPGHPGRAADFGICREIVELGGLPLLGVCLGYQGLALLHGATVARGAQPCHGRVSRVEHRGTGLFDGLPSPFEVVRYHSLVVRDLPPELEATAWTADGVLMGLRHRDRPMWGVQFHPESVCGTYGLEVLANFQRMSRRHNQSTRRVVASAPAARRPEPPVVRDRSRELRVVARALPTRWDSENAFDTLFRGGANAYWLDSRQGTGRFSIMGDAGGPLGRVATADVYDGQVTVRSATGTETVTTGFLSWLDEDLRSIHTRVPDLPFDFALGWVGYLGYELKAECGGESRHRGATPDAAMVFTGRAVVLDHLTETTYLLALVDDTRLDGTGDDGTGGCHALDWLDDTARRLTGIAGRSLDEPVTPPPVGPLRLRHAHDAYLSRISSCMAELAAGETYEVCLTNMIETDGVPDSWEAYRFLRRANASVAYGALLDFEDVTVLSSSPELFLSVDRDGVATSRPIKGTRPRGATPAQDDVLVADLRTSEKDRAENLMILDLVRNDLGRCADAGSVDAEDIFRVETYATVHQLVSSVRARLRAEASAVDCVRAAFPPGSMTGAPKRRTMRIIDDLEDGPRGVYAGAIGYFSLTGTADLSVVIRTVVLAANRVSYGVGGAIIALSDPEAEFEETMVKATPLFTLAGGGVLGTPLMDPPSGRPAVPLPRDGVAATTV
jgi:para-aminobenzoate synthetase